MDKSEALDFFRELGKNDIKFAVRLRPHAATNSVILVSDRIVPHGAFLNAFETLTGFRPEDSVCFREKNGRAFQFPTVPSVRDTAQRPANDSLCDEAITRLIDTLTQENIPFVSFSEASERDPRIDHMLSEQMLEKFRREPYRLSLKKDVKLGRWELIIKDPLLKEGNPQQGAVSNDYIQGITALYLQNIALHRPGIPALMFEQDFENASLRIVADMNRQAPIQNFNQHEENIGDPSYCIALFLKNGQRISFKGAPNSQRPR